MRWSNLAALVGAVLCLSVTQHTVAHDGDHDSHGPGQCKCAPRIPRRDIWQFNPGERVAIRNLMCQYITDRLVWEHGQMRHTWDRMFLEHHRHFLGGMEEFLNRRNFPLPIWSPETPIPPEFIGVEAFDNGQPRPSLQNSNPRIAIPALLRADRIGGWNTPDALAAAIRPWHDGVHTAVGGSMGEQRFSAAAPIFWAFHGEVDEMYSVWRRQRGID